MATKNPRITITLNEEDYAVLKRLNALNGVPMARTVSELVEVVSPVLARICDNLDRVKLADENVKKSLRHSAEKSLSVMEKIYSEALENFDEFSDDLERAARGASGRSRGASSRDAAAAGDAKRPRLVTRGSGTERESGLGG